MSIAPSDIRALVDAELANVTDQRIVAHIRSLLVEPYPVERAWGPERPHRSYTCWITFEDAGPGIVYCPDGPGPRWHWPWGIVGLQDREMGDDWYGTFFEAYFQTISDELPIWRVFKTAAGGHPVAITEEADWETIWAKVYALREADPASRYDCDADASPFLKARLPPPAP